MTESEFEEKICVCDILCELAHRVALTRNEGNSCYVSRLRPSSHRQSASPGRCST